MSNLFANVSAQWKLALSTYATSSSLATTLPTTTEPAASAATGVYDFGSYNGSEVAQFMKFILIGTDANNETVVTRIVGWEKYETASGSIWIPHSLGTLTGTLSSTVIGVDGSVIENEIMFADTITITDGSTDYIKVGNSPSDIAAACAVVNMRGFRKVQITCAVGTGASANCLFAPLP